jgi:hypothetical protein
MTEERRINTRMLFEGSALEMSLMIPSSSLEKIGVTYTKAWDISIQGASFLSDVPCKLGSTVNVLLYKKGIEDVIFTGAKVIRVDQIRSLDNPEASYKNVVKFDEMTDESRDLIQRGIE